MDKYPWQQRQNERREERRPKANKKFYKINPVAENTKEELKIYGVLSKDYKKDHPICEACRKRKTTEVHHKKGRGIWLNVVEFFMGVCWKCHRWIHDHPEEAMLKGWLLKRIGPSSKIILYNKKQEQCKQQP